MMRALRYFLRIYATDRSQMVDYQLIYNRNFFKENILYNEANDIPHSMLPLNFAIFVS
jgi:hypothetical protein